MELSPEIKSSINYQLPLNYIMVRIGRLSLEAIEFIEVNFFSVSICNKRLTTR